MEWEVTGRTVDEAIDAGLQAHHLKRSDVKIDVLDEGSKALFGLIGGRVARVRITEKTSPRREPVDVSAAPVVEPRPESVTPAAVSALDEDLSLEAAESFDGITDGYDDEPAEEEIQAALFLNELTALMGIPAQTNTAMDDQLLRVELVGENLGALIGYRGETLDAMQYLTSLQINRGRESYIRVQLDTENYRAKREETLVRLAERMASKAQKTHRRIVMEPMNPYERRVMHSALQDHPYVTTHSEGEEPNRRVVITEK